MARAAKARTVTQTRVRRKKNGKSKGTARRKGR